MSDLGFDNHHDSPGCVCYAQNAGLFCSVCAPNDLTADDVAADVNLAGKDITAMKPANGVWRVEDVAKFRDGPSSPSPCNIYSHRQHWFLVSIPSGHSQ